MRGTPHRNFGNWRSSTALRAAGALLLAGTLHAQAQGTFGNLNFESAFIPTSIPDGTLVPVNFALPSWTAYLGTNQATQIQYNSYDAGSVNISVFGRNFSAYLRAIL